MEVKGNLFQKHSLGLKNPKFWEPPPLNSLPKMKVNSTAQIIIIAERNVLSQI